jgi:1-phosphofructokinase family hexose kinase
VDPNDDERRTLLCITPALAIDRTAHVERIIHGEVLRPVETVALAGGKGVNAARAAASLGGRVVTTGIAGGHAGRWIVEELAAEGLEPRFASARAESRTTYVVVDDEGASVIVYERPSPVTEAEFDEFVHLLTDELLPRCGRAIVAGSLPGGISPESHGAIVQACRHAGRPLLVDATGAGLVAALAARPDVVKIGRVEAVEAGIISAEASSLEAAVGLVERGAQLGVVTDGAREVLAVDASSAWRVTVPAIEVVNPVGSGDAFNAGFSLALLDGESLEVALARGVAAGSANALELSAGRPDPAVARQLERDIRVESIDRKETAWAD